MGKTVPLSYHNFIVLRHPPLTTLRLYTVCSVVERANPEPVLLPNSRIIVHELSLPSTSRLVTLSHKRTRLILLPLRYSF